MKTERPAENREQLEAMKDLAGLVEERRVLRELVEALERSRERWKGEALRMRGFDNGEENNGGG